MVLFGILAGVVVIACILEIIRELHTFRVRTYQIPVPELEKAKQIKLVFLSDLHGKTYGAENEKLIKAVRAERPDYILAGGDMLTRTKEKTDQTALELFRQLKDICPVYLANGNHEQKMKVFPSKYHNRYEKYRNAVKKMGIHLLENQSENLEMNGLLATISGLELPVDYYGHWKEKPLQNSLVKEQLQAADTRRFQILMAHNPVYAKQYWEWGADMVLSGHLHGGIVRIPGIGGMITPQLRLFPRYSGDLYEKDGKVSIVSRGLGTHTVNIRLFNQAEVVSILLTGEQ